MKNKLFETNCRYTFHPKRYRIGEMEKYYSDMAAKGFHLEKRGVWLSKFSAGRPRDMKYRVEVVRSKKSFNADVMPPEQLAVYEDCGWEFVDNDSYIHIFRAAADSDTEEFYLDPRQQAQTLKVLRNNLFLYAIQIPATLLVFVLLNIVMGENIVSRIYLSWITHTYRMVALLGLIVLTMADSVAGTVHLSRLYRRMKKGIPLDHSPVGNSFISRPVTAILWVIAFVFIFRNVTGDKPKQPLSSGQPYITLQELGLSESITANKDSGCIYIKSPYGQYWDCRESRGGSWIFQYVFVLNDRSDSDKVAHAFMEQAIFAREAKKFGEMEIPGLDKAYFCPALECVAVKDNKVAIFTMIMDDEKEAERLLTAISEKWTNF